MCTFQFSSSWTSFFDVFDTFLHGLFLKSWFSWPLWFCIILFLLMGFSFAIGPLGIGVSLKFWSQMGYEWISFYIHPDWFHQSQDVCDSSSRLRTPWSQVVCFIHCSIPQDVVVLSTWCSSCFLDHATLSHAHLLVSTSATFKGLSCFLFHLYHCKGEFFCWGEAGR